MNKLDQPDGIPAGAPAVPQMGTVHRLADRRAGSTAARPGADGPQPVPDPAELAQWKLLASRAGQVLAALEAAAAGTRRPGLSALAAEAAGLRDALTDAAARMITVGVIWEDGYGYGLAAQQGRPPQPPSPRRSHPRPVRS